MARLLALTMLPVSVTALLLRNNTVTSHVCRMGNPLPSASSGRSSLALVLAWTPTQDHCKSLESKDRCLKSEKCAWWDAPGDCHAWWFGPGCHFSSCAEYEETLEKAIFPDGGGPDVHCPPKSV
eukprot:CAMPEP_0172800590 /NCGR_PEP_ID=MMETSP1075-20121228/2686_1 /TAXON_ID=2916 /ORGANISM="Ceratium fusus, Strain PA161109" /LENGTH=123 /DNA_ID=CAMNT_0013638525 /DNA_START=32 /DNA_END=403 /DNA_ORIENTATION=+